MDQVSKGRAVYYSDTLEKLSLDSPPVPPMPCLMCPFFISLAGSWSFLSRLRVFKFTPYGRLDSLRLAGHWFYSHGQQP